MERYSGSSLPLCYSQLQNLSAQQKESATKMQEDEKRLSDLEAENEELFSKATAAEEDADAATGKLLAARTELEAVQERLSETEGQLQELRLAGQSTSDVSFSISGSNKNLRLFSRPCQTHTLCPACPFNHTPLNYPHQVAGLILTA